MATGRQRGAATAETAARPGPPRVSDEPQAPAGFPAVQCAAPDFLRERIDGCVGN
ncbi:MAG TPA: hypothetical protein VMK13_00285 [Streptosporangiaceae bacterium]|nr:hypothetical protein [Streptosporangiaceae bacterium]